jgi:hypothetical protein
VCGAAHAAGLQREAGSPSVSLRGARELAGCVGGWDWACAQPTTRPHGGCLESEGCVSQLTSLIEEPLLGELPCFYERASVVHGADARTR